MDTPAPIPVEWTRLFHHLEKSQTDLEHVIRPIQIKHNVPNCTPNRLNQCRIRVSSAIIDIIFDHIDDSTVLHQKRYTTDSDRRKSFLDALIICYHRRARSYMKIKNHGGKYMFVFLIALSLNASKNAYQSKGVTRL